MGYTLEAIRKALFEAGVSVSRSTVHREANRRKPAGEDAAAVPALSPTNSSDVAIVNDSSMSLDTDRRSGKDIAEAFFRDHPTNPLIQPKGPP